MKKKRSRAIPPVLVQCEKQRVDDLRTSIKKSIDLLAEEKLAVDYTLENNKIRAIHFRADAFASHEISYTKANLMCDDQGFSWTYRPHLALSHMPDPHNDRDVITVLKMALRVLERATSQDQSRLQRTLENNDQIADLIAYWYGTIADDLTSVQIHIGRLNSTIRTDSNHIILPEEVDLTKAWLGKIKPCLFVQQSQKQMIFGHGSINRRLPISPIDVMQAINELSKRYPDLQLPIRA